MRNLCRAAMVLAFLATAGLHAASAVFQYRVPVAGDKGKESAAFLWIPPEAQQVRGVVIGGMTLMEREFAKDALVRQACADQQLAIVFLKCGLGAPDLQKVLDDFAKVSGYRELSLAPLMFVGHSAGGPQAHDCAVKHAARCFGLVQYRGGGPFNGAPIPNGIPTLMMAGEFDEFGGTMRNAEGRERWEGNRDELVGYRAEDEGRVSSIVVEPGAGHFAWSDRNGAYLALFIRKAAQARIPAAGAGAAGQAPKLVDVDPKSGWLTDPTIKTAGEFEPAAYAQYKGDKGRANWHFDQELAQATVAYHTGFGKKDQFIKWTDAYFVDAGARFFFSNLKWVGDGQTVEVHPAYADVYPGQYNGQGPRWAQAGAPAGHSSAPILVKLVSGPLVPTGPNTLRVEYDALAPATEAARPTFMAYSVGDAEYRYTEHVGMMPRGFNGLTGGKAQTITFPPVGNLKADSPPVELKATSDSDLPVSFHVACGPAVIADGKLKLAELPARATYPIAIKVVAYQFGSGLAPLVKTAAPVEQTIQVEKP